MIYIIKTIKGENMEPTIILIIGAFILSTIISSVLQKESRRAKKHLNLLREVQLRDEDFVDFDSAQTARSLLS